MLLAIDTSAGTSVAVVDQGAVLAERSVQDTRRHAEVIGSLIVSCLADASVTTERLSGVAIGMGPGPFTGLRVGIAAANAFGMGAGCPVLRVSGHDAVAFEVFAAGREGPVLVTTDARRRERYWSAYRGHDASRLPLLAGGPGIAQPAELEHQVTGFDSYWREDRDWVSAASVGLLAERYAEAGTNFAGPEPLYLRSPDVTLSVAPKRVTA